ncbi:Methionine synthase reductase [Halotydeus destructor]|nr:Methionine synthase reductase [Halotydeus destructor]
MIEDKSLIILYGSQTGQAKAIAEEINSRCSTELDLAENSISLDIYPLDLVDKKFSLEKRSKAVIVVSTTGEGEPPENALKFFRRVRKKTLSPNHLSHLDYALLGLGDSNYNRFANFGKDLDTRLQQLGAKHFIPTGFGDDAVGLELGVEPWIEKLLLTLPKLFNIVVTYKLPLTVIPTMGDSTLNPSLRTSSHNLAVVTELNLPLISTKFAAVSVTFEEDIQNGSSLKFTKSVVMESDIFQAEVTSIRSLVKDNSLVDEENKKEILEFEIQAAEGDKLPDYVAGDSFGFICGNADEEVEFLLSRLGLADKKNTICLVSGVSHLTDKTKLSDILKYYCELRSVPKKSSFRHFAEFCTDDSEKRRLLELSSREGADDYNKFVRNSNVNLLDVLSTFKTCKPSLEAVLFNLPCFAPRYYSVVNCPSTLTNNRARFALSVIKQLSDNDRTGSRLNGVFSGLIKRAKEKTVEQKLENLSLTSDSLLVLYAFKRKNAHFKLPDDHTKPLILVGPGTGVAPFIGFLQQRAAQKSAGKDIGETWLFFGCRDREHDFIYEKELRDFESSGVLTKLLLCFSREAVSSVKGDTVEIKYVQDVIKKQNPDFGKLIRRDTTMIYVCGDVKMMSVNVFNAFVKVLEDSTNMMHEPAIKLLRDMQSDKRYLQDVWI